MILWIDQGISWFHKPGCWAYEFWQHRSRPLEQFSWPLNYCMKPRKISSSLSVFSLALFSLLMQAASIIKTFSLKFTINNCESLMLLHWKDWISPFRLLHRFCSRKKLSKKNKWKKGLRKTIRRKRKSSWASGFHVILKMLTFKNFSVKYVQYPF